MDNETTPENPESVLALNALKRAASRARHALHQFKRYPSSPGTVAYLDKTKQELAAEYARYGEALAAEHLL